MIDYLTQLKQAKSATGKLRIASVEARNLFLNKLADLLVVETDDILKANAKDLANAEETGLAKAMLKRLELKADQLVAMAEGLREIAKQEDPIGRVEKNWQTDNGLEVSRVHVPIGVIIFVYESRPNVIVDAAGLCIKSGNVLIVRGGKEALESNSCLLKYIQMALVEAGLPDTSVQQLEDRSYETFDKVLQESKYLDLVVPRGRESLIKSVKEKSRVPVIAHERGLCHIYVDAQADLSMARKIIVNAKISNPATCNSVETVLIHQAVSDQILPDLINDLLQAGVAIRGDDKVCSYHDQCQLATSKDWGTEYLDLIIDHLLENKSPQRIEAFSKVIAALKGHAPVKSEPNDIVNDPDLTVDEPPDFSEIEGVQIGDAKPKKITIHKAPQHAQESGKKK